MDAKVKQSPSFRHLKSRQSLSPVELKEKIRKNCKEKLKNRRISFVNTLRSINENEIRDTLEEVYRELFDFTDTALPDEEEQDFLMIVKEDLIQEEFQWCLAEYEKSQTENIDWEAMEDKVICPVCQKTNLICDGKNISCNTCKWVVATEKSLNDLKNDIFSYIEKHDRSCNNTVAFTSITDSQTHIFLICHSCSEMQLVI